MFKNFQHDLIHTAIFHNFVKKSFEKKWALLLCCCITHFNLISQSSPEMVFVQGGTFTMGDQIGIGEPNEQPAHSVTLKSFKIAKHETTVAQWKAYCNATGRKMPPAPEWGWKDDYPIENICWDDAVAYCEWLTDKSDTIYQLPTEAQWEYAAKGGIKSKGNKYSGAQCIDKAGWYGANEKTTHPVCQKIVNEIGLYDMSGNVWEWCSDWFGIYENNSVTNPKGPESGTYRVLRGGGWTDAASNCRVTYRESMDQDAHYDDIGFRVVTPLE